MGKYLYTKDEVIDLIVAHYGREDVKNELPTSLRLNKTLYLLYAFYVQYFYNVSGTEVDDEFKDYPKLLFEPNFEAWGYGPTDPDVHKHFKGILEVSQAKNLTEEEILARANNPIVEQGLSHHLNSISNSSDFGLVHFVCEDDCWKNHRGGVDVPKNKIPEQEIIKEYTNEY